MERIGTTYGSPARGYSVEAADTGSLLVVRNAGDGMGRPSFVVIDTSTGYPILRDSASYGGTDVVVLSVHDDAIYGVYPADTPCELAGDRECLRYRWVVRYDVVADSIVRWTWARHDEDLRSRPRTIVGEDRGTPPVPGRFPLAPVFDRQGTDLIARDYDGAREFTLRGRARANLSASGCRPEPQRRRASSSRSGWTTTTSSCSPTHLSSRRWPTRATSSSVPCRQLPARAARAARDGVPTPRPGLTTTGGHHGLTQPNTWPDRRARGLAILVTACSGDAGTKASADNQTATSTQTQGTLTQPESITSGWTPIPEESEGLIPAGRLGITANGRPDAPCPSATSSQRPMAKLEGRFHHR